MNAAHIHLMLNHLPIGGMLIAVPILLVAWWRKSDPLARPGLFIVLLSGIITIPTFLSGKPTEELIEHLPEISENLIEIHEEVAEKAIWLIGAAALGALVSLGISFKKQSLPKWATPLVTVLATLSLVILAWTNNLGGQIRHPEIRKDNALNSPNIGEWEENEKKGED